MLVLASLNTEFGNKCFICLLYESSEALGFSMFDFMCLKMIYHKGFFFLSFSSFLLCPWIFYFHSLMDPGNKGDTTEIIGEVSGLVKYSEEEPDILCVSGNIICILFFARKAIFFV